MFQNHIVPYDNNWYKQNDFIAVNSVRISDLFLADGLLIYSIDDTDY